MYRIRFHGRGGQGIKTASRILGSAFFLAGYEVQDAPRYGAERSGAPIFAYVRADRRAIRERGVIRAPDLVVVGDDSLVAMPAAGVLAGLRADTALLIDTPLPVEEWRRRLNLAGPLFALPGAVAAHGEFRFIGATCAGAAAGLLGVVPRAAFEEALRMELGGLGAQALAHNLALALDAFDRLAPQAGAVREGVPAAASGYLAPRWIDVVREDVDGAAPTIHGARTSVLVKTGLWRTLRPVPAAELCKHCWWICATACPDSAIEADAQGVPRIDYDHCKGCLVCVAQCPSHAIAAVPEQEAA